jgi:hypothetical protein
MSGGSDRDAEGYGLAAAVRDVFGGGATWVSWIVIAVAGILGYLVLPLVAGSGDVGGSLKPWACAAYGISLGGLLTLLPRAVSLAGLGGSLGRRPGPEAEADTDHPWWPLRLVAAALQNTPPLRRTDQDFTNAVAEFAPRARGLLGQRLWPACAAAFTAPALGLISAWDTWGEYVSKGLVEAGKRSVAGVVAWPMIISIAAALLLMLMIVAVDQWTRSLLQRWSTSVNPLDAQSAFVAANLPAAISPVAASALPAAAAYMTEREPPRGAAQARPAPEPALPSISAQDFEGLGKMFGDG